MLILTSSEVYACIMSSPANLKHSEHTDHFMHIVCNICCPASASSKGVGNLEVPSSLLEAIILYPAVTTSLAESYINPAEREIQSLLHP